MGRLTPQIPPFDYLSGRELTSKLKEVLGIEQDLQLADVVGVPRGTISTWHQRNLTPYELVMRICLAKGVNLEALALGKGELYAQHSEKSSTDLLNSFKIESGKLEELEPIAFDKSLLGENLNRSNCVVYLSENNTYLVNNSDITPASGRYVLDIDGVYSINKLQRVPGNKVSIQFDDSSIVVDADSLSVLGKVSMVLCKE